MRPRSRDKTHGTWTLWPLWNMFDLTPEGQGTDWYPKHSYD